MMPWWLAGIVAGLIAGVAMAMVAMMLMPMMKQPLLYPVQLMAGTFEGDAALSGGMGTDFLGLMLHMVMSIVFGVLFAAIMLALGWTALWVLIVAGIVWALLVWAINQFVTLPIVDKLMAERMPPMPFAMTHIVYGVVLGVLFAVLR